MFNNLSHERDTLYHYLQKLCTRPAHFWFNSLWRAPGDWGDQGYIKTVSFEEALRLGFGRSIYFALKSSRINPQEFCDGLHTVPYSLTNICLGVD